MRHAIAPLLLAGLLLVGPPAAGVAAADPDPADREARRAVRRTPVVDVFERVARCGREHRVDGAPLPTLTFGRSDDLMIGETVVAIGNPLGYQHTVTAGVVSATDREIQVSPQLAFRGLIQTDASINPGMDIGIRILRVERRGKTQRQGPTRVR